jgi:GntR family transcriptional regulator
MHRITVNTDDEKDEPVYRQVARQLREMIASGQLPASFRLPAVRTLASDLGVNLNTVARAYRVLEDEGFIRIRGRSGAEVLAPPVSATAEVPEPLRKTLREVLARLRQAGLGLEELRQMVGREIDSLATIAWQSKSAG